MSANCWVHTGAERKGAADMDTPEVVDRKVKSLLSEFTMENFDSVSDQIVAWANKSENEKDGRTLIQVTKLIFEKATDEADWNEICARLCRKMMDTISPKVQDDGIKNAEGKPITGGQLFRKYLLARCQEDFERGWVAKDITARAAAAKASDDEAIKAANEREGDESEFYSDEYSVVQKAKRQCLGLIKFICELFKLQMLTERVIHECVKKLLGNAKNLQEEEIESLCQLLRTVGQLLDVPKARAHMDVYFQRMRELCESPDVSPRMQFMLQDVIDLRDRQWQLRNVVNASTHTAVCEAAAQEKAPQETQAFKWYFIMSPAVIVGRKVRSLLNKLTMENFDSISGQIVTWVNLSEEEKDARTLFLVVKLIFEKAINEADWNKICARLCRKIMETISPKVQDDHIQNSEGQPITGGQLFRIYLLIRCQENFERGWVAKEITACAAAAKASDGEAVKAANKKRGDESELYSDEYYAAQKAKRQGLGLIKFICELFKLQMLTERIVHECVKKLLGNVENPEEQEIESLCQLLKTIGQLLDVPKARARMDLYFQRMRNLCESPNLSPRMQFMLQDVIELRDRKWQSCNAVNAPTTLATVDEAAAKEKAAQYTQAFQQQFSMSRDGSKRGAERNAEQVPDDWAVTGAPGGSQPRPPGNAGDLSHFGKISKGAQMVMGPSSVFAGKKDNRRESLTRTNSTSTMFSRLSQKPELVVEPKPSRESNWRRSTPGDKPKPVPQRRKLQLLPRTIPAPGETLLPTLEVEPEGVPAVQMSEEDAKKKIMRT